MPALDIATAAEAAKLVNYPFFMVYLDVAGDPLWAWTGRADASFTVATDPLLAGGRIFLGSADIGSVSNISHAADGAIAALTLTLDHADFTDATTADFVNNVDRWSHRTGVVWFGYVTPATGAIVAPPIRLMTARMTHVGATDGGSPGISVKLAAKSATDGQRSSGWTLADAHHRAFFPGDTALQYAPQLQGKELRFGTPGDPVSRATGGGGGGGGHASGSSVRLQ